MTSLQFSWSDSVHAAISSCFFCFHSPDPQHDCDNDPDHNHNSLHSRNAFIHTIPPPRARPDELEGLLADSDSAAETLSLHSNLGDRRRKKRRRPRKGVRLFGFDLFGRPPIHLPESDDEEERLLRSRRSTRTISSSSTLDSDAAPLDAAALDELSVARLAAATAAAEEEQRRAKEERRRLRRERKELKRMALAMAMGMQAGGEEEFEGFPGSGPTHAALQSAVGSGSGSGSVSATSSPFLEEFGPFAQGQPEALDDDADFGADSYTRRKPYGPVAGRTASDSRSRSSASASNSNAESSRYHHHLSQDHLPPLVLPGKEDQRKKKRRSTRTKSSSSKQSEARSQSSASVLTTQSPSIPSPPADQAIFDDPSIAPSQDNRFEGFPGGTLDLAREQADVQVGKTTTGNFPSVGLRGVQRTKSDMGVFLARRGEE